MVDGYQKRVADSAQASIQGEIQNILLLLANPGCEDYPSYREKVGVIKGLRRALDILEDAVNFTGDSAVENGKISAHERHRSYES
jgi:hypothetical protein